MDLTLSFSKGQTWTRRSNFEGFVLGGNITKSGIVNFSDRLYAISLLAYSTKSFVPGQVHLPVARRKRDFARSLHAELPRHAPRFVRPFLVPSCAAAEDGTHSVTPLPGPRRQYLLKSRKCC